MDKSIFIDYVFGSGLFLFTGAEMGIEGTVIEVISKFGVIAVLWFWLREMKSQMKQQREQDKEQMNKQLDVFDKETTELRAQNEKHISTLTSHYEDYKNRFDQVLKLQNEQIKILQTALTTK